MDRRLPSAWRGILAIAATWLVLFALGFPLAFVDDLYFIGPAINLAHGGPFGNPWCPGIGLIDPEYASRFFVYMPLYGHVLAGWLMIFGLGTHSLLFFQCLCAALATYGLAWFMRPVGAGFISGATLSLCVALYLGGCGLRPEALGLALFCWGLSILRARSLIGWTLGCLCLFATVITSPNIGILVPLVLIVAIGFSLMRYGWRASLARVGVCAVAGMVMALVFLLLIDFQFVQFLTVFNRTRLLGATANSTLSNYLASSLHRGPRYLFRFILMAAAPYVALLVALGLMWWRRDLFEWAMSKWELLLVGLSGILLIIPANSSGAGYGMPGFYALLVGLYALSQLKRRRLVACGLYAVFFLVMVRANGNYFVQVFSSCLVPTSRPPAAVLAELNATSHARVYLDSYALRSVFNYQIPPNGFDYNFGDTKRFAWPPDTADFPADSVIVGSVGLFWHHESSLIHTPVIGFLLPDEPPNPYELAIMPIGAK